jgi:hypothetical protein
MRLTPTMALLVTPAAVLVVAASAAAAPLQARTTPYGGIGATVANFRVDHPNGPGAPPRGTTYYRIDQTRDGRVWVYHVVVGWISKRSTPQILARLTGKQLPADATPIKSYNGYCAVYRSSWLGHAIGLPYIVLYAPEHQPWWTNGATASLAPACRG